jgi:hypothetical protein
MNIQELEAINEAVYAAQGYEHMPPPFIPAWQRPGPNGVECLYIQPRYSSDLNAAFKLVEEMRAADLDIIIVHYNLPEGWTVSAQKPNLANGAVTEYLSIGADLTITICNAYIVWKEQRGTTI